MNAEKKSRQRIWDDCEVKPLNESACKVGEDIMSSTH